MPGVLEGDELGVALAAGLVFEDDVVVPIRVEWRIEVNEINRLIRDVSAEDFQVVAVVEQVGIQLPGDSNQATIKVAKPPRRPQAIRRQGRIRCRSTSAPSHRGSPDAGPPRPTPGRHRRAAPSRCRTRVARGGAFTPPVLGEIFGQGGIVCRPCSYGPLGRKEIPQLPNSGKVTMGRASRTYLGARQLRRCPVSGTSCFMMGSSSAGSADRLVAEVVKVVGDKDILAAKVDGYVSGTRERLVAVEVDRR